MAWNRETIRDEKSQRQQLIQHCSQHGNETEIRIAYDLLADFNNDIVTRGESVKWKSLFPFVKIYLRCVE